MKIDWTEIERVLASTASAEEVKRVERWAAQSPAHRRQMERMRAYYADAGNEAWGGPAPATPDKGAEAIVRAARSARMRLHRRIAGWSAAAAVTLALAGGAYWLDMRRADRQQIAYAANTAENQNIILKTDRGEVVRLDSGGALGRIEGLVLDPGVDMARYETVPSREAGSDALRQVEYHTLVVPKGRSYALTLSDGTVVHLNADSELRYPVTFGDGERRVSLRGEAYFQVRHDAAQRFVVSVGDAEVRVYGTSFNISAYGKTVEAVLVDGSVGFGRPGGENMLRPGERISYVCGGDASIDQVDASKFTSWVEGYLTIDDERLCDIEEKLERIYNVRLRLDNDFVRNLVINCHIRKGDSVESFLDGVECLGKATVSRVGAEYVLR